MLCVGFWGNDERFTQYWMESFLLRMHDNRVSAAHKTALSVLHSWEQQQLKVDVANRWRETLALPCGTPCSRRSILLWRVPHGVLNRQEQKAVSLRSIGNYKIARRWTKVTKRHSFSKSLVAGMWFDEQKFPIRWNRDKQACARALRPLPPVHWFTGKYKDSPPRVSWIGRRLHYMLVLRHDFR